MRFNWPKSFGQKGKKCLPPRKRQGKKRSKSREKRNLLENKEKRGFIEIGCGCYGDRCPSERRKLKIRSTTSFLSLFIFLLSNSIFFFFFYSRRSFLRLTFLLTFYATLFYVFLADKVYATQKMSLDFFFQLFFFPFIF